MILLSRKKFKKSSKKKTPLFLLLFSAIAGIAAYVYFNSNFQSEKNIIVNNFFPNQGSAVEGHLPDMTEDEIREQMQKEADKSIFSFKINSQPLFEDGNDEGTLGIENPQHNVYPFVVEIFLNETGEKIYDSGGILPNHHIATAKLMKTLSKGTHTATAYINAYDPETKEYRGKAAAELKLLINE